MKRAEKKRRQKLNNKGMTLIEILVAMIILSLVSVTFLEIFSFSLKLNTQAKVKQHALSFSQSLMEGVKAYGRDTLDEQFDEGSVGDSNFKLLNLTGSVNRSVTIHTDGTGDTGKRTYKLENVLYNGEAYDATVVYEPVSYTSQNLVEIEEKNQYYDGFFKQRGNENELLLAEIETEVQAYLTAAGDLDTTDGVDLTKVTVNSRNIAVNIAADDKVTVTVTYTYSVVNHPVQDATGGALVDGITGDPILVSIPNDTVVITYPEPSPDMSDPEDAAASVPIYDNTATATYGAQLEKLYLYYYPAYKDNMNGILGCTQDTITIDNDSSSLREIHIFKQRNPLLNAGNYLNEGEADYDVDVSVISTTPVEIYHNMAKELQNENEPCSYSIAGSNYTDGGEPWKDDTDPTYMMYDINIKVTKQGETEVLCELDGTTNFKTK